MDKPDTFVLTGCASGIALHLTNVLSKHDNRVFATDIRLDALETQANSNGWDKDRVHLRKLDVRDPQQWDSLLDDAWSTFGTVDVVMNIAGYLRPGFIYETDADEVNRHFDINVKGVIFGSRAATQRMIRQGHGHIINISSMAGLAAIPGLSLYSASKFAVRGFSLAIAQELKPKGVHVTTVCLDAVATPMLDLQKNYREAALTFSASRILTVDDVAKIILGRVLSRRPMLVIVPSHKGWLARTADTFPSIATLLYPLFQQQGLEHQARMRG